MASVEPAQPREDTLFSLLPCRDCKEIMKCAINPRLRTAFVSRGGGGNAPSSAWGPFPCPPPTTVPLRCVSRAFSYILAFAYTPNPGSPGFSLVTLEVLRDTGVLSQY